MVGNNLYQSLWEKFPILKIRDGNSFHFQGEIYTPEKKDPRMEEWNEITPLQTQVRKFEISFQSSKKSPVPFNQSI